MFFKQLKMPLKNKKSSRLRKNWITKSWQDNLKIECGNILSGEKLFADGETLEHLSEVSSIGKNKFAGEMEGYGYGYACRQNRHLDWLIFRGISDFGGQEKSDLVNKKYQIIAALSAAALVREYLLYIYNSTTNS